MLEVTQITNGLFQEKEISLDILRLDKIHPIISGNKWFKLKYNIEEAQTQKVDTVVTFGGAFSNHIAATAEACRIAGVKSVGFIRGEKVNNNTLDFATKAGMELNFVSREEYRHIRGGKNFEFVSERYPNAYIIPEGGSNELGVKGAEEILNEIRGYDRVICSVGTGGTVSGLIRSTDGRVIGIPALKNDGFLERDIKDWVGSKKNWELVNEYHFGGYAKHNLTLLDFIIDFKADYSVQLDPIYTGKMMFGVFDLIEKSFFDHGARILAIHTGGLQGIQGFEERFKVLI